MKKSHLIDEVYRNRDKENTNKLEQWVSKNAQKVDTIEKESFGQKLKK